MAVSSMLQLDPSFPNHSHFSTQTISVKPAIHRGDPIPAYATGPEHERASLPLFCIAPENDTRRFELYEVLEQVYSAVWSGRTRVSNYTFLHLDQRTKRWLYQTAFEVLNRMFVHNCVFQCCMHVAYALFFVFYFNRSFCRGRGFK